MRLTHASVFSGIGGPEIAATMLGWDNAFHCEINPFGRAVLDYWYPKSKSYEDITKTDFSEWRGRVDVLSGGFPCQPFSYAGQRRGAEDDRYLWPSMYRAIDEIQPTWVVAENVAGILTMVEQGEVSKVASPASLFAEINDLRGRYELRETFTLQRICTDLESHGYAVQPVLVPACAVGAPHRRDRVFIVARRRDSGNGDGTILDSKGEPRQSDKFGKQGTGDTEQRQSGGANSIPTPERIATDPEHLRLQHDARRGEQAADIEAQSGRGQDSLSEQIQRIATVSERESPTYSEHEWTERLYELLPENPELPTDAECIRWFAGSDDDGLSEASQQGERGKFKLGGADCSQGRWRQFPSVSPVHRGNDGLPFDVDRLTLSFGKWRTEALKAYGNAIVPQVMYEIFRAIEIVER